MKSRMSVVGLTLLSLCLCPARSVAGFLGRPSSAEFDDARAMTESADPDDYGGLRRPPRDAGRRPRYDEPDASHGAPRRNALPRTERRFEEQEAEGASDSEISRHEREMQRLTRKLEEAEQTENPRQVKAINYQINQEVTRHDRSVDRSHDAPPARLRPRFGSARGLAADANPPDQRLYQGRGEDAYEPRSSAALARLTASRTRSRDNDFDDDRSRRRSASKRGQEDREGTRHGPRRPRKFTNSGRVEWVESGYR